jgi:hypothetical protein
MKRPSCAEEVALLGKVEHARLARETAEADYTTAIVNAAHAGVVHERIAAKAGITRSRVGQLAATHTVAN